MNLTTFLASIFGGAGGGIVVSIVEWIHTSKSEKAERKISFLDKQIRELYGPLYYFVSQSEKFFELNSKFHNAYKVEYVDKEWSREEATRKALDRDTNKTIDIANKYVGHVRSNNKKIKEILDNSYSLIDPDDVEIFSLFSEHYTRLETEQNEDGKLETPFMIYKQIGDISFLRPEFMARVKEKFLTKKKTLGELVS